MGLAVKRAGWENFHLHESFEKYAARMEVWDAVGMEPPCNVSKRNPSGNFIPVRAFSDNKKDITKVVDELADVVLKTTSTEYQSSLFDCLSELVNNFFDHARSESYLPCLLCAQSWPKGGLIQIAIADAGIGIRESLSQNKTLIDKLHLGNACKIASQYGITGKPENNHSGYGLTLAKDLMIDARGKYYLFSGDEYYYCTNEIEREGNIGSHWQGTLLILEWKIDTQLNSKSVYENWPIPDGFNEDDFF